MHGQAIGASGFTGNASTATAFAGTPTTCGVGAAATGILSNGNATGCFTPAGGTSLLVPIDQQFTYYVDCNTGSDGNTGTSPALAWNSASKALSTPLSPGQSIGFLRGCTWRGNFLLPSSGTAGARIVYGAYGAGPNPKLNGSTLVSGWTLVSGSIYNTSLNYSVVGTFAQVFQDGIRLTQASSQAAMVAGSYWWASGHLYVWTTDSSNPSTHVIETGSGSQPTPWGLSGNGQSFIIWDSIDLTKSGQDGFQAEQSSATNGHDMLFSNMEISWNAERGVSLSCYPGLDCNHYNIEFYNVKFSHNIGESFWSGFGKNNGCVRCEMTDTNVLIGAFAVNNYLIDSYVHNMGPLSAGALVYIEHENVSGNVPATGSIISQNVLASDGSVSITSIIDDQGINTKVTRNLLYATTYTTFLLYFDTGGGTYGGPANGGVYENNTIANLNTSGYSTLISFANAANNMTFKNNILTQVVTGSSGDVIDTVAGMTGLVSDYNDMPNGQYYCASAGTFPQTLAQWKTACGTDAHSVSGDPLYADIFKRDFRLQPGSPAINAALPIPGVTDLTPYTDVLPDMGAFEFSSTEGPFAAMQGFLPQPAKKEGVVAFSATPLFAFGLSQVLKITLTGNVTSSTAYGFEPGENYALIVCEDATGGRTFSPPSSITNWTTISTTANACTAEVLQGDAGGKAIRM